LTLVVSQLAGHFSWKLIYQKFYQLYESYF